MTLYIERYMQSHTTLGSKIRDLRKKAGISQFKLEMEIGAAPGSISRIESGKVNPTKETLLRITKILGISDIEFVTLIGIRTALPSHEERVAAIAEAQAYLDKPTVIGYLLDEAGFFHYVSRGMKEMLSLAEERIQSFIGKHILEIVLDPQHGIFQLMDYERSKYTFAIEVARMGRETTAAFDYFQNELIKLPGAKEVMELAKSIPLEEVLSPKNKQAFFKISGGKIQLTYTREPLKHNSRFEIVEFINPKDY